jgi:3-deoxy-manno-octulosonate cytidylyltransferase (CMP-KDO synthetase)
MKIIAVIPCRFQSSRFEGKPLELIGDKPMLWHVYQQAIKANSIDNAYIATDDLRISRVCEDLGLNWLMTSSDHLTGTDRVAECASKLDADILVNVQGDEPFILPDSIDSVVSSLINSQISNLAASNGYSLLTSDKEANDKNVVKVIFSSSNLALAYSRLPIPSSFRQVPQRFRQLGLYAFYKGALEFYAHSKQGPIELAESVEMYRFIEHNKSVLMVNVQESGIAVDTPADLFDARQYYKKMISTNKKEF